MDSNLRLELFASNISRPTNIAFLNSGEVLRTRKKYRISEKDCERDRYSEIHYLMQMWLQLIREAW